MAGTDKVVHFLMYGVLAFLAARAARLDGRTTATLVTVGIGIALLGGVDEWHQQFIPGRSMERADWMADALGALAGTILPMTARKRPERPT